MMDREAGAAPKGIKVVLVNPNVSVQISDPYTTGIIYMPIGLASIAAQLKKHDIKTVVIDAFGQSPNRIVVEGEFAWRGISAEEVKRQVPEDADAVVVYAINLTYYSAIQRIIKALESGPPVILVENTQAVTSFNLEVEAERFVKMGVSCVVVGEGEKALPALLEAIKAGLTPKGVPGIVWKDAFGNIQREPSSPPIKNLDALSFPDWSQFPLANYWGLKYAHGPMEGNYLPLLSSRGCPYGCRFCVIPSSNLRKWRPRSAKNVVDEMEHHQRAYGVSEFHFEDLNPTVSDKRTKEICREIIDRGLKVIFKFAAGTKVETIKGEETVVLLAKAGCNYISISPESGSDRLLKAMDKPFDWEHAARMVRAMNRHCIYMQACFIVGFPGETDEDLTLTERRIMQFTRLGVDEIAVFIVTPVPGSAIFADFSGYTSLSELTFSPSWRTDYDKLNSFRISLYRKFLINKLLFHPLRILRQPFNFLHRSYKTKMEMVPYKAMHVKWLLRKAGAGNVR